MNEVQRNEGRGKKGQKSTGLTSGGGHGGEKVCCKGIITNGTEPQRGPAMPLCVCPNRTSEGQTQSRYVFTRE